LLIVYSSFKNHKGQALIFKKQVKTYLLYEHPHFQDELPLWLDEGTFLGAFVGTVTGRNGWFFVVKSVIFATSFSAIGRIICSFEIKMRVRWF
jgi:hypothetical protein